MQLIIYLYLSPFGILFVPYIFPRKRAITSSYSYLFEYQIWAPNSSVIFSVILVLFFSWLRVFKTLLVKVGPLASSIALIWNLHSNAESPTPLPIYLIQILILTHDLMFFLCGSVCVQFYKFPWAFEKKVWTSQILLNNLLELTYLLLFRFFIIWLCLLDFSW